MEVVYDKKITNGNKRLWKISRSWIASDYSKLSNMLNLCDGDNNSNIINQSISGETIVSNII